MDVAAVGAAALGQEYVGVLFFDEKDARSSILELPILGLDLDEPGPIKG